MSTEQRREYERRYREANREKIPSARQEASENFMYGSHVRPVTHRIRQLDYVPSGCIEPFGRVRDRGEPGWVVVVGRSARTVDRGALVRCGINAEAERNLAKRCRAAAHGGSPIYGDHGPLPPEECEQDAMAHEARARLADEWSRLPLIVLAGLR
jgi:hypothetical protein